MPEPLLGSAPFRKAKDADLAHLLETVTGALDPDAVELELVFFPDGRRYRRRFASGSDSGARLARAPREALRAEVLTAPFEVPDVVQGSLSLVRRSSRPWTGAERLRFELLRPLVAQVLELSARSEGDAEARRRLLAAVEGADSPILMFDRAGTILFANEAADALLSRQTEEGLALLAHDRRPTPLLSHLLKMACDGPAPCRERIALTNGRSLEARAVRLPGEGDLPGVTVLTLRERETLTIDDVKPLLYARGISEREAQVVKGVLQGRRNAQIAGDLFLSEYTVKDHLKHIFAKLAVDSRGALIRALYAARSDSGPDGNGASPPV